MKLCPFCKQPPRLRPDTQVEKVNCKTQTCALYEVTVPLRLWEARADDGGAADRVQAQFTAHTKAVGGFLSEMAEIYSLDALENPPATVQEVTDALLRVSRNIREKMAQPQGGLDLEGAAREIWDQFIGVTPAANWTQALIREAITKHYSPIPVVVHCPRCGTQHIDKPDLEISWTNPPHKSHLCLNCETVWRPASVPTTGVESVPQGEKDTWPNPCSTCGGEKHDPECPFNPIYDSMK